MTKILMATSEAVPFAKTGGLADVCGSLPRELARLGHETRVIMPAYPSIYRSGQPITETEIHIEVPVGQKVVSGRVLTSHLPDSEVPVYFIEQPNYFDREGLYGQDGESYRDNCERFVFFCRAVMESIRYLNLEVDILHAHDWQTGLLPAFLEIEYRAAADFESMASVLTIHNLAYQGRFWHWDMLLTGLDWKYFNWKQMEYFGKLNLLKTGIVFADAITTVSPRYAEEIQGPELGCGLENLLQLRSDRLEGIMNGVDYETWNPKDDPHLTANYDFNSLEGKRECKATLQQEVGLPVRADLPVIGFVGRLAEQKGLGLIIEVIRKWVATHDAQWILLGSGDRSCEQELAALSQEFPHKIAVRLEFSSPLAHQIESGSDIFAMPSRYEPCGLNQLYSLRYGTPPVVHATGGLADSVTDTCRATLADGTATGFVFNQFTAGAFEEALQRAYELYRHDPVAWQQLMQNGMRQDWSWARSARQYIELYRSASAQIKSALLT